MKRWLFDQLHKRNLIYNQCWEDPTVDHEALNIKPEDRIVMITSAGCNALDYLLREPESIDCVDLNPHQTALLELKIAALQRLDYHRFFSLFGTGRIENHRAIYVRELRPALSTESRLIWDRRIDYFTINGPGLYFSGTSGLFARALNVYIDWRPELRQNLKLFQEIDSLEQQARFYTQSIAPELWTTPLRWIMRRPAVLSLLGVPIEQIRQMRESGVNDLSRMIEDRVDRMFTRVSVRDNYFWRVYINGHHSPECCPNYLKAENFERMRELSGRLHLHTTSLADFLRDHAAPYSVFVLLDHMDWLTSMPHLLQNEWKWILKRATAGARIIYRSGGETFDHIPAAARQQLVFDPSLTRTLSTRDRVGTYGSFHLARVLAGPQPAPVPV